MEEADSGIRGMRKASKHVREREKSVSFSLFVRRRRFSTRVSRLKIRDSFSWNKREFKCEFRIMVEKGGIFAAGPGVENF